MVGLGSLDDEGGVVAAMSASAEFEHGHTIVGREVEHRGVDVGIFVDAILVEDGDCAVGGIGSPCAPARLIGISGIDVSPGIVRVVENDVGIDVGVADAARRHL